MRRLTTYTACCICLCFKLAAQCNNEDFENGTPNGWVGRLGRIVQVPNDFTDTSTAIVEFDTTRQIIDGRHTITSGQGVDPYTNNCDIQIDLPEVEPTGMYSLRLGNDRVGRQAESVSLTFQVENNSQFFLYKYAVVLEDPGHIPANQPRFEVRVYDEAGESIDCGRFSVTAGVDAADKGFTRCTANRFSTVWVKDWTTAGVDLTGLGGTNVTVEFITTDCGEGAHFGYAYVEASCKDVEIQLEEFCPGNPTAISSITEGFEAYQWSVVTDSVLSDL